MLSQTQSIGSRTNKNKIDPCIRMFITIFTEIKHSYNEKSDS